MRLQLVFLSDRCTLIAEMESTILSSTSFSAKSRTVHLRQPALACAQARAVRRASNAPSKVASLGWRCGLRVSAASSPSSTKRCFEVLDGARAHPQRGGGIGHFPRTAKLTRITQEQGAGMDELCGWGFAVAGPFGEVLAFAAREGDFLSNGHVGEKPGFSPRTIRN